MATTEIIYHKTGHGTAGYYTAEGMANYAAYVSGASAAVWTPVEAERHDATLKLIDPASGTLYYSHTGSENGGSYTLSDGRGTFRTDDGATHVITVPLYKVGGAFVRVYGAHPNAPGFERWYTDVKTGTVNFVSANTARYRLHGAFTYEEGEYGTPFSALASGTAYDAAKVVYSNSSRQFWLGASAAPGRTLMLFAGYYWFAALSLGAVTPVATPNASTRTVANGKRRALVTDVEGYNAGSASATVKASTGSVTFAYWRVFRQGLGDYGTASPFKMLPPWEGVDGADGSPVVLRGLNTKADGSGTYYPVGSEVSQALTRRPSLDAYDLRVTLYAVLAHRRTVTLDADGGTGGTAALYFSAEDAAFFADAALSVRTTTVQAPAKPNAAFEGYADADGTLRVGADGAIAVEWTPSADCTLTARWRTVVEITLDRAGGAGGCGMLVYDSAAGGFRLPDGAAAITSVAPPARECFAFGGYWTAADGGTQYIGADGAILEAMLSAGAATPTTLHARWTRVSYRLALDANGGNGGGAVYCNGTDAAFFADPLLEDGTDEIEPPERTGHVFLGYWTAADGGELVIPQDGSLAALAAFQADAAAYAHWEALTYTATFDYRGGAGAVASKPVTFGEAVGALPVPTSGPRSDAAFAGWALDDGSAVTEETVWSVPRDATLAARWVTAFGNVTDWFGLASDALVPVSSDAGDNRTRVAVAHNGRYEAGVNASSGVWRSPRVTYAVKRDTAVTATLGRAFAASGSVSGYMVVAVTVETRVGQFPSVTVEAAANEGADAINKWTVAIPVAARSKAQNLLGGVVGGGKLNACTLRACCDPVVVEEATMPCASDAVNGRLELSATIIAASREDPPAAGGGFAALGAPEAGAESSYTTYALKARREL